MINLPYGIDSFSKLRESNCYYVDKTGIIGELLQENFEGNLITRPRRFGKTLTMRMLEDFFDIRKDSRELFEGLEISRHVDLCAGYRNQWPVLFLTLKDVSGYDFPTAYRRLKHILSTVCIEHSYLEKSDKITSADRESFHRLMFRQAEDADVEFALDTILRMLTDHYGKKAILLIDEYDVPLAKASDNGYYREMLDVVRGLLSSAWKSNNFLKFAVVTGCLRIAKESIFTGANNFVSNSIADTHYSSYIGFTEPEVAKMLADAGFAGQLAKVKQWYDGYRFGNVEIYCPWDVLLHIRELGADPEAEPGNHWTDTSHNDIIRKFIENPHFEVREKIESLLSGGMVWEPVVENMSYDIAHSSEENLWSILYLTGYLTKADVPREMAVRGKVPLRIPNEEVKAVFADKVKRWFEDTAAAADRRELFAAWWEGRAETLTEMVSDILNDTISYYDYREDYYHAFLAGLFTGAGYAVESNMEYGLGRTDVVVKDRKNRRAIIIEAKRSRSGEEMEKDCYRALGQIQDNHYAGKLGRECRKVVCYGAAFFGKSCLLKALEDNTLKSE